MGVKVANGSAHGLGIYLAKLEALDLSMGFADEVNNDTSNGTKILGLLVCGVLDDAAGCSDRMGGFLVTAKSQSLLHVGNAMVAFNASRVLPLFYVSLRPGPFCVEMFACPQ